MQCPHCGAQVSPGNRFCQSCRKRVVPPGATAPAPAPAARNVPQRFATPSARPPGAASLTGGTFERPFVVTFLAALNFLGGVLCLLAAAAVGFTVLGSDRPAPGLLVVFAGLYGLLGLAQIIAGVGLLGLKPYGRVAQIALAGVGLLAIPLGTVISILILVYFFKPGVKLLFSGRSPRDLSPAETAEVAKVREASGLLVVIIVIVVVLAIIAMIGIVAAIAIPSLLRARVSANESAAIGDLRTVISAQATYASANGDNYDRLECLAQPTACIPGNRVTDPILLRGEILSTPTRRGYVFSFHPGPPPGELDTSRYSPSSVKTYAYVAVPVRAGQTGVRAYCSDSSGLMCFTRDGTAPRVEGGMCPTAPSACEPLPLQ